MKYQIKKRKNKKIAKKKFWPAFIYNFINRNYHQIPLRLYFPDFGKFCNIFYRLYIYISSKVSDKISSKSEKSISEAYLATVPNNNIVAITILIFVFQLLFPQYSYAYDIDLNSRSMISVASLKTPLIMEADRYYIDSGQLPPSNIRKEPAKIKWIWVTAYSSTPDQTDSTPFTTANGRQVADGIVAANWLPFGSKVMMPDLYGAKVFSVEDRMHERFSDRMDIWMKTRAEAQKFGAQWVKVEIY